MTSKEAISISERIFTPETAPAKIINRMFKAEWANLWPKICSASPGTILNQWRSAMGGRLEPSFLPELAPPLQNLVKEFGWENPPIKIAPLFPAAAGSQLLEIKTTGQPRGYFLTVPFREESLSNFRPLVRQLLESGARINDWLFQTRLILRFDYGGETDFADNHFPSFEFSDIPDFLGDIRETINQYLEDPWARYEDRRSLPGMPLEEVDLDENWYKKTKPTVAALSRNSIEYRFLYWHVWLKNKSGEYLIPKNDPYVGTTVAQIIYGTRLDSKGINGAFTHIEQALLDEIQLMARVWDSPLLQSLPKELHGCNILTALMINLTQRERINHCLSRKV